jgi:hypothetical protein
MKTYEGNTKGGRIGVGFGDTIIVINLHFLYHYYNIFFTSSKCWLNSNFKKLLKYILMAMGF